MRCTVYILRSVFLFIIWFALTYNSAVKGAVANVARPPPNWDSGGCKKWSVAMGKFTGSSPGCRKCTDPLLGFGDYFPTAKSLRAQHSPFEDTKAPESSEEVWLRIAVGTIPRKFNVPYLRTLLESLSPQLDSPSSRNVQVSVYNLRPGTHVVFDRARKRYADKKRFRFSELKPVSCDPPVPPSWVYKSGLSPEVSPRQQIRDVVSLMLDARIGCKFLMLLVYPRK